MKGSDSMRILGIERKRCLGCRTEHHVYMVEIDESTDFNGSPLEYTAVYEHCPRLNGFYTDEDLEYANNLAFRQAHRKRSEDNA